MMGKISFFLGLQISQSHRGIFINQSKYALESLKKYGFESCDPVDTLMVKKSKLDEDKEGKAVDPSHYRGIIGTLLYLTASRPDLQFAICMCARSANMIALFCQVGKGAGAHGDVWERCGDDYASLLDCLRKMPVDLAFAVDFQSCVRYSPVFD
nr:uncharacterized mitochondrial protein AtMg00810-like [Tanacetum cinerariifolium]